MTSTFAISAPSRLHFGLFALGQGTARRYGGVGAMVEKPGLRVDFTPAERWECSGPLADRAEVFARRWVEFLGNRALPGCRVEVTSAPPQHVGLGVGTQLGLAVAYGLGKFCGLPTLSPPELALSVGRAERSAVGTYGFAMGGLIVEKGKSAGEPVSQLDCRIDLPAAWRFVLLRPLGWQGLSGSDEAAAMDALPVVSPAITDELVREACERLVPAAATGDFSAFAESLYRYGHLAGSCFAARQGGPYNGPELAALVAWLRENGAAGVGQSSWGPTLFAIQPDETAAQDLARSLKQGSFPSPLEVLVTPPNNQGVRVSQRPFFPQQSRT